MLLLPISLGAGDDDLPNPTDYIYIFTYFQKTSKSQKSISQLSNNILVSGDDDLPKAPYYIYIFTSFQKTSKSQNQHPKIPETNNVAEGIANTIII
jgi:hypothetical protein